MNEDIKLFEECIEKIPSINKIQRNEYLDSGRYPIISQEANLINGYWDNELDVFSVTKPVIVFGDHTRALKFVDFDFVLGADGVKIIKPKSFLDSKYFYYFLLANPIKGKGYARHYRFLKDLKLLPPPLATQQKIVAKLDAVFAEIDKAIVAAEANSKNAELLFQSYLTELFNIKDSMYIEVKLGEIVEIISGSGFPVNEQGSLDLEIPFYKVSDMNLPDNHTLMISHNNSVSKETAKKLGAKIIEEGSVIFPKIGGAIATNKKRILSVPSCIDNNVMALSPKKDRITSEYLYHLLSSIELSSFANEANLPSIKKSTVEDRVVAIPNSLSEQVKVSNVINAIKSNSNILFESYQEKVNELNLLKQSVLQQAFNGELVKE